MTLVPTPESVFATGRPGDPRLGEFASLWTADSDIEISGLNTLFLYGCPDDAGVTANRGRPGAAAGPDAIRTAFYNLCPPFDPGFERSLQLLDAGNITVSRDITATHQAAFSAAKAGASLGATIVALGGGHDFAAPNVLGWCAGVRNRSEKAKMSKTVLGLINVDPHLDVRELENSLPHSGTPFRQILESKEISGKHFIEFGAREGRNASSHADYCRNHKVNVMWFDDLRRSGKVTKSFDRSLKKLASSCTDIALTLDMDCCSELEGVSAAPVIGFSAWELCQISFHAGRHPKVSYLELAEVAPPLDPTGRSARIAAEVLFYFLKGRLERVAAQ